jgi:hypothetical protein
LRQDNKCRQANRLASFQSLDVCCVPFENLGEYAAWRVKHFPMFEHRC